MQNRKRDIQIIVRVMEAERDLIMEKMKQIPMQNLSAYARKMLIDGYIILLDMPEIKAHSALLQKIGVNVNQIASRVNETACIHTEDIAGDTYQQAKMRSILRNRLSFPMLAAIVLLPQNHERTGTEWKRNELSKTVISS